MKMNNQQYKIALDLDGVMADFERRVLKITGKKCHEMHDDVMWKAIKEDGNFFEDLHMMPDAQELWDYIKHRDVEVLTGTPRTTDIPEAAYHKRNWVKKHLSPSMKVNTCLSKEKRNWAKENYILIDDRNKLIQAWEKAGGIGILHRNTKRTIEKLKELNL